MNRMGKILANNTSERGHIFILDKSNPTETI